MSTAHLERHSHARLGFHGSAELCVVTSDVLRGNPLGDPHVRELPIYLPADHAERPLPLICAWLIEEAPAARRPQEITPPLLLVGYLWPIIHVEHAAEFPQL